ncbi:MAG: VWA domain-containing protein [Candidatus Aureabacteria bacterium]|nr:VWA domain-containing protein [Candidatus Auribacterota bacterium]
MATRLGLEFTSPRYLRYLWLIVPVVAMSALAVKTVRLSRIVPALIARTIALFLIIAALAGVSRKGSAVRQPTVLAAVDVSDSMGAEGRKWAKARAVELFNGPARDAVKGVILFARGSEMREPPGLTVGDDAFIPAIASDATDISSAIRAATLAIPRPGSGCLVIFSDGNQNSGDALSGAASASREGIRIDCVALPRGGAARVELAKLDLPEEANITEMFTIRIVVSHRGSRGARAMLSLRDGEKEIKEWAVAVQPGTNAFELPYSIGAPGVHRITVALTPDGGAPEVMASPILVIDKPKVLCVSGSGEGKNFLAEAVGARDIDVKVGGSEIMPLSADRLAQYDCVILSSLPRRSLTDAQMKILARYVREGGGLIVLGGANNFGAQGYRGTPIEEVLPVTMEEGVPFERDTKVRLCIILVIDKSDSMGWFGGSKIMAARRAAEELVKQLKPNDRVGIISFDTGFDVLVPLGDVGNKRDYIIDRIRTIQLGSGTIISRPLRSALEQMIPSDGRVKHVILITDGDPNPPDRNMAIYRQMIADYCANGVTLSTIGIGRQVREIFLKDLAMAGGNYYYIEDATMLPIIVLQDTRKVLDRKGFLEDTIIPRMGAKSDMLKGIAAEQIPRLKGYIVTTAKPRADVVLYTDVRKIRDPLLASWRAGLGKAVVFTSDAEARWSAEMVGWGMYRKFWTQVVRWTMRARPEEEYLVRLASDGGRERLVLQQYGAVPGDVSFRIAMGSGAHKRSVSMHQVAPETYEGEVKNLPREMDAVTVEKIEGGRVVSRKETALIRRVAPPVAGVESQTTGTDEALLAAVARSAGGVLNPAIEGLTFTPETVQTTTPLAAWLLPWIFILFLADIALRKFRL